MRNQISVTGSKPELGWYKLNTDDSFAVQDGDGGAGFEIRVCKLAGCTLHLSSWNQ